MKKHLWKTLGPKDEGCKVSLYRQRNYARYSAESHPVGTGGQDKWSKTPWSFTSSAYTMKSHGTVNDSPIRRISGVMRILLLRSVVDWVLPARSTMLNKSRFYFATCDWLRVVESTAGREERFVSWWSTESTRQIITLRCDLEN